MVVPDQITLAAARGDVAPIEAWLNEGNDVNDRNVHGDTMLLVCVGTPHTRTASHTDLVRLLIEHGADVNSLSSDSARIDVHRSSSGVCDPAGGTVSTVVCSVPALRVYWARCSSPHMPKDDGAGAVSVLVPTTQARGTDHVHCGAQPGFGGVQWESS